MSLLGITRAPALGATADTPRPARARATAAAGRVARRVRVLPELAALLALAAVLDLWALDRNGWANAYYSAAVRSMSSSWHDFLYASFDPSGVMTVDKPPLALWVQTLSVRLFGFHPVSILRPQALMGIASVAFVYDLTRRLWGRPAGLVARLVLALTPITVAISRHNNPDALLVLCCVGALWCLVRGLQDGRGRWIVLSGVCVGLGFETKMGAALLVVPTLALAWLCFAPRGLASALRQLLAGGAGMVVVGGAWPLLVALTPASSRPWIAGTSDNSILSLILDYNGFGRFDGQLGGPGGAGPGGGGGPGGGTPFGGASGPFRLLNEALGGQASWLLGFAVVALVALAVATRLRRSDARSAWLIATGGTFATTAIAFSAAKGIFHPYYVAPLAPFTAALVGAGSGWFLARRGSGIAAAFAVATGVAIELVVLHQYSGRLTWLPGLLAALGLVLALGLIAVRTRAVRAALLAAALVLLLLAPASWAIQTLGHVTEGTFPAGGPATVGFGGGPGGLGARGGGPGGGGPRFGPPSGANGLAAPGATQGGTAGGPFGGQTGGFGGPGAGGPVGDSGSLTAALQYVQQHGGGTIAVSSQTGASAAIIQSGADVAGIGGFSGRESEVTTQWLAEMVREGRIRWVIASADTGGLGAGDGRVGSSKVMAAVAQVGRQITLSDGGTLYDLGGQADALAAVS